MEHTKWKIGYSDGSGDILITDDKDEAVVSLSWGCSCCQGADKFSELSTEEQTNAQRIVACVNACQGITGENLKSLSEPDVNGEGNLLHGTVRTIEALNEALDQSEKVKAELLEAGKKIVKFGMTHNPVCNFQSDECEWCNCGVADIKTAIQKAEATP